MKKLLFIDACMRDELSRTKKIATPIIENLKERYDVETFCLNKMDLKIVDKELITKRNNKEIPEEVLTWARTVANADRIVIAAPFWDMSFPAALKNFFELVSIFGITFDSNDKECFGLCKAEKVLYITTRGMDIKTGDVLEQATPYLKALSWLWGLKNLQVIEATNMDYVSEEEINNKVNEAIKQGLEICKDF